MDRIVRLRPPLRDEKSGGQLGLARQTVRTPEFIMTMMTALVSRRDT
jgi:hypothetical protein